MQRRCPLWSIRRKLRRKSGAGRPAGRRFCAGCWQRLPARACSRTSRACAARCFWRCWCCLCRSGRWRSGWRSSRRACGASGRRRLRRCSCSPPASPRARRRSPPRRSALSKRAFRRRQRRLPRTNRRRSSRQSPIYPTPNRNPRHPLTSIRSRKHRPPLNRKFPPLPRPIPRRRSRPRPAQSETVYITQTGKKYHRAGCRHLQKSQIPISLDDAKAKGYTACKSCGG